MMFSKLRILAGLIALSSTTMASPLSAQDDVAGSASETQAESSSTEEAVEFARSLTENATNALTSPSDTEAQKLAKFQSVLSDGLALDVIGKFMLGESRKTMTAEQTARYEEIFPKYITKIYAEQFADIVGKPLEVIDSKALGARDVIVRTRFDRTDGSPINVDWRIRKLRTGEQKAIDIIVSGVSIMLVKREEFSAFIAANGMDNLLDRLAEEAAV